MIAQLTGRVDALADGTCVIDVGGVGYLVQASSRTLSALPQPPAIARVLVETHVREDAIVLFGFADAAERDWFRLLTTVQGVGGKRGAGHPVHPVARRPDRRHRLRRQGQPEPRARRRAAPGGADGDGVEGQDRRHAVLPGVSYTPVPAGSLTDDVVSALVNLGYRRTEALAVVTRVRERLGEAAEFDAVIRDSLRDLAQRAVG